MTFIDDLLAPVFERAGDNQIEVAGITYDPRSLSSREDVQYELGITEREFVEAIILDQDGAVRLRSLTTYTDWSVSETRDVLTELEAEGAIVLSQVDEAEVVSLPAADTPENPEPVTNHS